MVRDDGSSRVPHEPFYVNGPSTDKSQSITSFLCTDTALDIYDAGRAAFAALVLAYPNHKTAGDNLKHAVSNEKVLANTRNFFEYATTLGKRGTPHKL